MNIATKKALFIFTNCLILFSVLIRCFVSYAMSTNTSDPWSKIEQKLEIVPNTFSLHSPASFAQTIHTAGTYDNATSYIAIDMATGQILFEKNSTRPLPIASLTKLMSAVVALDLVRSKSAIVISHSSTLMPPTKIGVVEGEKMTVEELLHAMLMTSANDAAQALQDGINARYGQNIFITAMNEKARFLGLTNTHFTTVQGFDYNNNESSARDLAMLTFYALSHYPLLHQIVQKQYLQLPASTMHKQFDLYNWNGLLGVYPGATGVKIGNTHDAGYTTIVEATRENHTIVTVLLGAPGTLERDMWAAALLDDAFATFGIAPAHITPNDVEGKYVTWQYWN